MATALAWFGSRRFRAVLLATSALAPLTLTPALGNPQGGQVAGGSATIQSQGSTLTVNQTSDRAIINWQTFNIGSGETTRFVQPGSSSIALNRVTGGLGPSFIDGTLTANGRVFIINADGIMIGAGARIDTAGFLATTNDITNANFMAGRYNFTIAGNPSASIVNAGTITASNFGFAGLVAPGVRNSGTITATFGKIGLASGNDFTLDFYGDKLITLAVNDSIAGTVKDVATGKALTSLVSNDGTLKANGGTVQLTAVAARQIVDSVINNRGVIEARSIGKHKGKIVLGGPTATTKVASAPTQTVKVSGKLDVSGKKKGTTGGTIEVTGENIVVASATLDVSGSAGGGKVLIGGDVGGGHPSALALSKASLEGYAIPNATSVSVDGATTINASAISSGDGGKVVVWSDGATAFAGAIQARGGATSGNGGFVETSGHMLNFADVRVDTSASNGRAGSWLLDPTNLTVDSAAAATISSNLATTNVTLLTTSGGTSGSGVTSSGAGDIVVNAPISWSSARTLTLNALNDISINAPIAAANGGLTLKAANTITAVADVSVGTFTLQSGAWTQVTPSLPTFVASDFRLTGGTFLRALGGDGSSASPYQIADVYGLQGIGSSPALLSQNYQLANDVNASGTVSWNSGVGFVPIGTSTTPFAGVLDGQYHLVDGLNVNSTAANVGLFGYIGAAGVIKNVGLTNATIFGGDTSSVGGIAGYNAGTISQSYISGTVSGGLNSVVGGLVGRNTGSISQSYSIAEVHSGAGGVVGGLVGQNLGGNITESYSTGLLLGGIAPNLVSTLTTNSNSYASTVSGHFLFVADNGAGLKIYDISNPNSPSLVGTFTGAACGSPCLITPVGSGIVAVFVRGNYAYVGDSSAGFGILDVSNPATPVLVSTVTTGATQGLTVAGNYAYVGDFSGGKVSVVDIRNPALPVLTGSVNTGGNPYGIAVQGNYLYVANQANGQVQVVDVTNPANPNIVGVYHNALVGGFSTAPTGIFVSGSYAYVADALKGLYILNVSNPADPKLVGSYEASGIQLGGAAGADYFGVSVVGNYAYVADNLGKLKVLDISNPALPHLAGLYAIPSGAPLGISVAGDRAYVADDVGGLKIFDISHSGTTIGGLVGANVGGTATNSYWDVQTSGAATSALGSGKITSDLVSGLPIGFDAAVWGSSSAKNSGYPNLLGFSPPLLISITVTADDLFKIYGTPDPTLTYQITSGILSGSDAFSGALTRATGQNVGTYAIGIGSLTLPSLYNITLVPGIFTVTPAPLTIRADDKSRQTGTANPALTASYIGLVAGDGTNVVSGLAISTPATPNSLAGAYSIVPGGASASNYTISYINGVLTVTAAASKQPSLPAGVPPFDNGQTAEYLFSAYKNTPSGTQIGSVVTVTYSIALATAGDGNGFVPISQRDSGQYSNNSTGVLDWTTACLATVYAMISRGENGPNDSNKFIDQFVSADGNAKLPSNIILGTTGKFGDVLQPLTLGPVIIKGTVNEVDSSGNIKLDDNGKPITTTHYMLATSESGSVVIANDPWTGLQVKIDVTSGKVFDPADYALHSFTATNFTTISAVH